MSERKSNREIFDESRVESSGDGKGRDVESIAFPLIAIVIALLVGGGIYAGIPFTHSAKAVKYNVAQLANASMVHGMLPEIKEKTIAKLKIDFNQILTPVEEENSDVMRAVAQTCLPGDIPEIVMPGRQANRVYDEAGAYLACAMQVQMHRFCYDVERVRLIEQLYAYRDRRQNVLAFLESQIALLSNEAAQQQIGMVRDIRKASGEEDQPPVAIPSLSEADIHEGVTQNLAHLVGNGLLSPSDFGYFGFYLPEEYLTALTTERTADACQG